MATDHSESPATDMMWHGVVEVLDVPIDERGRLNRRFQEHAGKILKILILKRPDDDGGADRREIDVLAEKVDKLTSTVERLMKLMVMEKHESTD